MDPQRTLENVRPEEAEEKGPKRRQVLAAWWRSRCKQSLTKNNKQKRDGVGRGGEKEVSVNKLWGGG